MADQHDAVVAAAKTLTALICEIVAGLHDEDIAREWEDLKHEWAALAK